MLNKIKKRKSYKEIYIKLNSISRRTDELRYSYECSKSICGLRGTNGCCAGEKIDYEKEVLKLISLIEHDLDKIEEYQRGIKYDKE